MRWWMRFPWTRWVQRLYDRWHSSVARSPQPPVTFSVASPVPSEPAPAPIVPLPSDGQPWDWGWLFGNGTPALSGIADTPATADRNAPDANVEEPQKNNPITANTEAIDAVFADYASSSETAPSGVALTNAPGPIPVDDSLAPPAAGAR